MAANPVRPMTATVFGVFNIIFGVFGVIGLQNINNAFVFLGMFYGIISILSSLVSVVLLVAGIFLIIDRGMALKLNMYYIYSSLALTLIGAFYLIMKFGLEGMMGGIVPILIGLIYPLLLLFVLLKNNDVKSFYSGKM
jgi:hypothetical protein